jgi:purine-cytosine permease-like protein
VYGAWSAPGLLAYFVGFVAQLPFMVLPFFVGPAAVALGRVDISFLVGLVVSATAYVVLAGRAGVARGRLPNV